MENEIKLKGIIRLDSKITYQFDYSENLRDYFSSNEEFFIEHDGINIEDEAIYPDGILIIPFLCNVLPIVWLLNITIYIDEVDKEFYDSIPEFKKGYINMYPFLDFKGNVIANRYITNNSEPSDRNLMFFSGGLDSYNTLVNHYKEKPILVTLWGSDIFFDDIEGWNNVKNHVKKTAELFDLEYKFIKSNFRKFINTGALTHLVKMRSQGSWKESWWHDFQHGIGIIGHAAPLAFIYKIKIIYIASSFSQKDKKKFNCASDPTINNHVKIACTKVINDGYELSRQDKIKNICNFSNKHPDKKICLRVCWQSSGGQNCNLCEKCYRTIMGLLAEGKNPNDYGLFYNKAHGRRIKNDLLYKIKMNSVLNVFWQDIQNRFLQMPEVFSEHPELKWIKKINFERINKNPIKSTYYFLKKVKNKAKRMIKFS